MVRAQVGPLFKALALQKCRAFFVGLTQETSCSSLQKGGDYFVTDSLKYFQLYEFSSFLTDI
ncbi:MAG: hypothetical protein ABF273_05505, partial [Wenyingzhuangia sp.]